MIVIKIVIVLAILILVHEFGHFIVAKKSGIRVDEFGLGLPPRAWGKKFGETLYSLNWIPFGGFVKIFGEDPSEADVNTQDKERSFHYKPKYIQAAVIVAGVVFNYVFAILLMWFGFMGGMPGFVEDFPDAQVRDERVIIAYVLPESQAAEAELDLGATIVSLEAGGESVVVDEGSDVPDFVAAHQDEEITFNLSKGDRLFERSATPALVEYENPQTGEVSERVAVGIELGEVGTVSLPPHKAFVTGFKVTWNLTKLTTIGLYDLIADAVRGEGSLDGVSGPVGIATAVDDASKEGFGSLLYFVAIISVSLAVLNLVPFPALDGGRLLFIIIESITGKPIKREVANTVNAIGFILIIALMIFITYHDIISL